ncbi:MAG: hypothetical protein RLZZ139_3503, partial [Cyanobacteriota bacterium]
AEDLYDRDRRRFAPPIPIYLGLQIMWLRQIICLALMNMATQLSGEMREVVTEAHL